MPKAIWFEQLVVVSAMAIPFLRAGSVLDVGSGAGVPGLVLSVLAPHKHYILVESNGKKAGFIDYCRDTLDLKNMRVENRRIETLKSVSCDNIIARAFGPLSQLLKLTWHLGHQHTHWLSWKGAGVHREVQKLDKQKTKHRVIPLEHPLAGRLGSLVCVSRRVS